MEKEGVGAYLGNIQKTRDGEPLTSKRSAADDFGAGDVDPITGMPR